MRCGLWSGEFSCQTSAPTIEVLGRAVVRCLQASHLPEDVAGVYRMPDAVALLVREHAPACLSMLAILLKVPEVV